MTAMIVLQDYHEINIIIIVDEFHISNCLQLTQLYIYVFFLNPVQNIFT